MYYKITNGSISYQGNTILEEVNFIIKDKEKIGIVGRNGTGKTSLLKSIINEIPLEQGLGNENLSIQVVGNPKIGYIKQENNNDDMKMLDYILTSYQDIIDIENKINNLEERISTNYQEKDLILYNELLDKYKLINGYGYKKEYEVALAKFGFTDSDKNKLLSEFSSGQRTKLSFIKLLLSKPDILILDEPTNHLDITTVEWLEEYLKNYPKSIVIVSHDRMFLDNVCNVIYEIEYGSLKRYSGNYSYYLKRKEEDYHKELKDYEYQQKEIKRLTDIANRFRYKPTKAKMALSKLKQIEHMTIIDKPVEANTKTFHYNFNPLIDSYSEVLKVKNLQIGYDKVLSEVNFNMEKGDRIGIIGKNGCGKSTFIKTILGIVSPIKGKYSYGKNVTIGYFDQEFNNLHMDNTVYEEIDNEFSEMSPNEIRSLLAMFEFYQDDVFKKISNLSGGEKVKLSLCKVLRNRPNLLILDEPTNHLDIISKSTIENMLLNYKGSIIIVSHDRYLINKVCNKLLVFEDNKTTFYNYGYSEYIEKNNKKETIIEPSINTKKKVIKEYTNISKEINKLEKEILNLENKLSNLNNKLYEEDIYLDKDKYQSVLKEIEEVKIIIKNKEDMWDNLTKEIE